MTLEPVCAKVLTSLIRNRKHSYRIKNNYIEIDIPNGFWTGISGTVEHTVTLTFTINHARRFQRNLIITLLDLKNAFGELGPQLINSIFRYHHIADDISSLVGSFYTKYS